MLQHWIIYDVNVLGLTYGEMEKHITDMYANNIDRKCRTFSGSMLDVKN